MDGRNFTEDEGSPLSPSTRVWPGAIFISWLICLN